MPEWTQRQHDDLVRKAAILELTLDAMEQGISVFDADLNVVVFNRRFLEILGFPAARFRPGDNFETFIRYNAERGEYGPGDVEAQVQSRLALARTFAPHHFERTRPDGTVIEIRGTPVAGGGFLTTYTDVTERRRSERAALQAALDAARTQLNATLESVSAGIGLFDRDDRLVLFNSHYREVYPGLADVIRTGVSFEQILRTAAERGIVADAVGRRETWFEDRMARHRNPGRPFQQRQADGRWIQIDERRTAGGGIVAVFTDVSELKSREEELAAALRDKEALLAEFNTIMDTIEYGVLFLGPDLRMRLANRAFAEMWHFPSELLTGHENWRKLSEHVAAQGLYDVPAAELQQYVQRRYEAIKQGDIAPVDLRVSDGRVMEFQCKNLPDGGRMVTYFDISPYRRSEENLAAALRDKDALLAEFNTVLDTIEYGVMFLGPDLHIRLTNRAFGEMWRFPPEVLVEHPSFRSLMEYCASQGMYAVPEDDIEAYLDSRYQAVKRGDIAPVDLRLSDGRVFEYQCTSLPDGGRMVTYFDITAYRRSEAALKQSEQRFKDFASSSSDWTWEMGPDLRFTYAAERMLNIFHITPDDVVGKTREEIGRASLDDEAWCRHVDDMNAHRPFKNFRYPITSGDGETRWITTSGLPLFADDGTFLGYRGTASDVTKEVRHERELREAKERAERALADLKQAQTNLVHAEKLALLGQLVAGIAHEIKNPLNFVTNFADLSIELLGEMRGELNGWLAGLGTDKRADIDDLLATLAGNLGKIREHGSRADAIVRSMLAHSREGPGEKRLADVNALIEESLSLAYHGARAQDSGFNATLERDLDPAAGQVEMVPQDISRVLLNLFANGFQATQERVERGAATNYRPAVKVSSRRLDGAIEIRVRDNGTGMPEGVAEKIFTPFYTTKPAGKGTGLGLSLSYDIVVHQHSGTFTVDTCQGEYAEFVVRLPCTGTDEPVQLACEVNTPGRTADGGTNPRR